MDDAPSTLAHMSNEMDNDFRDRMLKAAAHAKVAFSPQSIGTFLGVDRRKAAVWMDGSLPRADKLFEHAERFGVDPKWYATGKGQMLSYAPTPELPADEAVLIECYRKAEPRWRLSLQMLAHLATEDQIEVAGDVNMVLARVFGKKPHELRPISNKRMRDILRASPQGWPPKPKEKEQK